MPLTDGSAGQIVDYLQRNYAQALPGRPAGPVAVPSELWQGLSKIDKSGVLARWQSPLPATVSRATVAALGGNTATSADRQLLFLVTMAWGKNKARWPRVEAFSRVVSHPRFESALEASAAFVRAGLPAAAYDAWFAFGMGGIREAFVTKWLYACGCAGLPAGCLRPLVLDSQAWKSLTALGWTSWCASGYDWRSHPGAVYGAYLRSLHDWASVLGSRNVPVDAEALELFLYRQRGQL